MAVMNYFMILSWSLGSWNCVRITFAWCTDSGRQKRPAETYAYFIQEAPPQQDAIAGTVVNASAMPDAIASAIFANASALHAKSDAPASAVQDNASVIHSDADAFANAEFVIRNVAPLGNLGDREREIEIKIERER